jgi:capsular polysaccharide biosynthesis protein
MNNKFIFLPDRGHINIYHFLFYMVGNLYRLKTEPEIIALNISQQLQDKNSFIFVILQTLYPNTKIIHSETCPSNFSILDQDPEPTTREEPVNEHIYNFLRSKLLTAIEEHIPSVVHTNIYISRKNNSKRCLLNEEDFNAFLLKHNFKTLILEDMHIFDQMAAFNRAKNIISIHGAALSNIIVCRPQTRIIELCSPKMTCLQHFSHIAKSLQLNNYTQYTNVKEQTDNYYESNLYIDIEKISELEKLILT